MRVPCDALSHEAFYVSYQPSARNRIGGIRAQSSLPSPQPVIGHSGSNYGQGSDGHLAPSSRDATAGTRAEARMKSCPMH